MNIIIDLLFCILTATLSYIIFGIIFFALNNSILRTFITIQSYISKIRKKELFRLIFEAIFTGACVYVDSYFNWNLLVFGALIGFSKSLIDILFLKGFMQSKRGD